MPVLSCLIKKKRTTVRLWCFECLLLLPNIPSSMPLTLHPNRPLLQSAHFADNVSARSWCGRGRSQVGGVPGISWWGGGGGGGEGTRPTGPNVRDYG